MSDIINKYPYTDLHSVNLDYILKIVRENAGLHLEVSGNQLLMKTADNTIISAITIPYATSANTANTASSASYASTAGSAASAAYATEAATAATATTATSAAHATSADTATSATSATNATNATYATTAGSATNATNAINAQTAAYAETTGSVTHAQKAIESVTINGDKIRFTTYDGSNTDITAPYAVKAQKDDLGNVIKSTYIANVIDDNGVMKFNDAQGNTIISLTPSASMASVDNYGNNIADYVKAILVSSNSNYVTVDHGDGTSDSITIHYSETAWKDSNGNVIKNSYVKRLAMVTDPNDGHKKLVAYNGDTPEAEIFRLELEAYSAQIAQEANHAARADFAITAAEAQTALTSSGSVSSITSPNDERQKLVIANGDGTNTTINIFKKANPTIYLVGASGQDMPFDSGFTVGHTEEYSAEDFENYGWDSADLALEENVTFSIVDNDREEIFTAKAYLTTGAGITVNVFDYANSALKVFRIIAGNADDTLIVERLM